MHQDPEHQAASKTHPTHTPPLFAGSLCVTRSTKSQNTKQPQKHIQHINTPPLFAGSLCLNVQLAQLCPSAAAPPAIPRTDKNLCKKHLLDIFVFDVHDSHDSVPLQLAAPPAIPRKCKKLCKRHMLDTLV